MGEKKLGEKKLGEVQRSYNNFGLMKAWGRKTRKLQTPMVEPSRVAISEFTT